MTPGEFRRELQKDKNFDMSKMVAGQIFLNFFVRSFAKVCTSHKWALFSLSPNCLKLHSKLTYELHWGRQK